MPYIHWESYSGQAEVSELLDNIKEQSSKTRIWTSQDSWWAKQDRTRRVNGVEKPSQKSGGSEEPSRATNKKTTDYDAELLNTYLFKRWPLHMRRTLHQYYYSYLADTQTRDCDQVTIRARSRNLQEESKFTSKFVSKETKKVGEVKQTESKSKGEHAPAQNPEDGSEPDRNCPVVMVDQLWLWVVSQGRSAFPFCDGS
jgi:hypothetical protein